MTFPLDLICIFINHELIVVIAVFLRNEMVSFSKVDFFLSESKIESMVERTRRQIGVVELVVGVEVAQFDGHLGRRVGVDGVAVAGHRRRRRRRAETGASVGAQPPAALVVRARRPPRVGQFLQAKVFFLNSERIQFSFGARLGWNDDAQPEVLERISGTMGGGGLELT